MKSDYKKLKALSCKHNGSLSFSCNNELPVCSECGEEIIFLNKSQFDHLKNSIFECEDENCANSNTEKCSSCMWNKYIFSNHYEKG